MQASQLLTADVLDIIFDGKNKAYGAYDLRKTYNNRLRNSLLIVASLLALMIGSFFVKAGKSSPDILVGPIVHIPEVEILQEPEPIVPEPPAPKLLEPVRTEPYTIPKITPDKDVLNEDMPPENKDLENARIGLIKAEGVDDNIPGLTGTEPHGQGTGIVDAPAKGSGTGENSDFVPVEIESQYPGGNKAWGRFLYKNLGNNYPVEALDKNIEGTVVIQFIVDIDGTVSKVEAISGPEELRETAVTAIKKSGKWEPAIQNGNKVKSYKKQPITFKMPND